MTAIMGYDLTATNTVQQCQLGTEINVEGATYRYCKASAAVAVYQLAQVADDGTIAEATTTTAGAIPATYVIPQIAFASGDYGWAPCGPFFLKQDNSAFYVNAAVSCAKNVKLYTTATAGVIDDAATTAISGLQLTETITTARAATCTAVTRLVSTL